jgi:lipopolysaccharide/colanic/teichoic acid biosynthesis glycosyltransferase
MRIPSPTSRTLRKVNLSIADLVWAVASPILALYLRDMDILSRVPWSMVASYWMVAAGFSCLAFVVFRIDDEIAYYFSVHGTFDIIKAVAFAELATCIVLFVATRLDGIPRSTPIIHGLILAAGLIASRMILRIGHGGDRSVEDNLECGRIIIIGANCFSSYFIKLLNAYSPERHRIIALLDDRATMIGRAISGVRVLGPPQHLGAIIDEFVIHGIRTEQVIIASESNLLDPEVMRNIQRVCEGRQIKLSLLHQMIGASILKPAAGTAPLKTTIDNWPLPQTTFFRLKRLIDILGSLTSIVLLFPLLMSIALLVLLDVGAPVLFWQRRLGYKGRSFHIYKFRTLRSPFDAHGNAMPKHSRLSAIGRFLRSTRMDELPQLINVLKGDMSLIGPRPLLPEDQPSTAGVRLSVRPGITGWAQINGGKLVTPEEKEKLDDWYIRNASLRLDFRIILLTFTVLLESNEASAEALADAEQAQKKNVTFGDNPLVIQEAAPGSRVPE